MSEAAAAFFRPAHTCIIDHNMAHRLGRDREEMISTDRLARHGAQFEIRLIDNGGGLQCRVAAESGKLAMRQSTQFPVKQLHGAIKSAVLPIAMRLNQTGDVGLAVDPALSHSRIFKQYQAHGGQSSPAGMGAEEKLRSQMAVAPVKFRIPYWQGYRRDTPPILRGVTMSLTMKRNILFAGACAMAAAGAASAQDVTLPFDGNAAPGTIVTGAGATAPSFVPGQSGQAIYFSDESAVAVPAEIDPRSTPQISITAWIKRSPTSNYGWLIDSGSNLSLPSLRLSGGKLAGRGGRDLKTMSISSAAIPPDEWTFIAGIWDFSARSMQLYKGDQSELFDNLRMDLNVPTQIGEQKEVAGPGGATGVFVTIGAVDFINFGGDVNGVAIDDVRIYKRALSAGEITTLAGGGALAPEAPATPEDDPDTAETNPAEASPKPEPVEGKKPDAETPGLADPRVSPRDPSDGLSLPEESTGDSGLPPAEGYDEKAYSPTPEDKPKAAGKGKTRKPAKEKAQEAAREKARKASEEAAARRKEEEAARRKAEQKAAEEEAARKAEEENAAVPGGKPFPVGDPVITRISGGQGGVERRLELARGGPFMERIAWFEKADRPCRIEISGKGKTGLRFLEFCGNPSWVGMILTDGNRPIAAIQVCNNRRNSKNRLKGIRVWGDTINPDGTTSRGYSSDEDELANCTQWDQIRRCPENYLATGVVIVADDPGGAFNEYFRGLRLICRRVEMR
jgi:hypothetical protein